MYEHRRVPLVSQGQVSRRRFLQGTAAAVAVAGVLFSGGLIGPPGTAWDHAGSFAGTPVFLGCSDVDTHVPAERVRETAAVFTRMGAAVTMRLYPGMGHLVNDDEIHAAQEILDGALR